ncbi:HAD family hydrolase [Deinococcus sp.]|uniref:Cof-type HAD-IIB family hydrolase n=1 Tax=Deinococcus sp. TaxID=47478 RepID=UPI0025F049F4|nr:HAD family hydrolase [Deinococcus sp.]
MPIRLIATDLDGTLLNSAGKISPRNRRALDAARAAGIEVVPVTARQPHSVYSGDENSPFTEYAVCSNGALGLHLSRNESLFESHLEVAAQRALTAALTARVPGALFASVRERGAVFLAQAGYAELARFNDHGRQPAEMGAHSLEAVCAEPSLKFIVRHARLTPRELLAEVQALKLTGFALTHSGAPFLEIMAEGVSKARGLAHLCTHLGIDRTEVLAFGDALNDLEMLAWAGRGVAMGNSEPEVRAAAREVTASNDEDGVALVIERLLGEPVLGGPDSA